MDLHINEFLHLVQGPGMLTAPEDLPLDSLLSCGSMTLIRNPRGGDFEAYDPYNLSLRPLEAPILENLPDTPQTLTLNPKLHAASPVSSPSPLAPELGAVWRSDLHQQLWADAQQENYCSILGLHVYIYIHTYCSPIMENEMENEMEHEMEMETLDA